MKIIRNDQLATLTIVPIRASEERVIISIIEMLAMVFNLLKCAPQRCALFSLCKD